MVGALGATLVGISFNGLPAFLHVPLALLAGALAGGLWVRLSFGPLVAVGEPPQGAAAEVVWFTDHAYRLEEVVTEPA